MRKARVPKSWSKHNLPDDLWPEILSRLPVKSLLRFRCVSRSWKTWIDDPDFIRLHLTRFNNRPDSPILFVQSDSSECVVKNCETLRTISSLGFLQSDLESVHVLRTTHARQNVEVKRWSIVSSIDGLFLLKCEYSSDPLMLWNPSIRKTLTLPPPPVIRTPGNLVVIGMGFDPSVRDYKVVRFIFGRDERATEVYTLKTNSWKVINSHGGDNRPPHKASVDTFKLPPICFNGVLYGLAYSWKLGSFDLRSEVYALFELPVTEQQWSFNKLTIVDDGSSLALVNVYSKLSIWTLESLGDDTKPVCWIQRYTCDSLPPNELLEFNCDFLCMKKNGEMLIRWCGKMICYNLETHHQKKLMEKNRKRFNLDDTGVYMESLLLLS